jgi:hypothetical protein
MRQIFSLILGLLALACLLATGCDGSNGVRGVLGDTTTSSQPAGQIPIEEGLTMGAAPVPLRLDPCVPNAPRDPVTGKLIGTVTIVAVLRDAALQPIPDVAVTFQTSAGSLQSSGQPVLTNADGIAKDMLMVDEDDEGNVEVSATTDTLSASLTVPVQVVPAPPIQLSLDPVELWPPNHDLREVVASFPGLECSPGTTFVLESATSNEADDGNGDGDTANDIQGAQVGTADTTLLLRAERAGGGQGRIYTIVYRIIEETGATSFRTGTVTVPHDQGH